MNVISTRILPKFLKDVFQHIPTLALKSVKWKIVFKEMGPLIFRLKTKSLEESKKKTIQNLNIHNIELENKVHFNSKLSTSDKKKQGQLLLKLYFNQFKNPVGLNLDIRSQHFEYKDEKLKWSPNNCWHTFDNSFREALLELYSGFYHNDDEKFENALKKIGLTKNLDLNKINELKILFKAHFGHDGQSIVKFSVSEFSESFYELFHYFVKNEVELSKDFIFLGIYLVTLYLHLEELDESFDVKSAFLESSI
jgi:hypothetical protein